MPTLTFPEFQASRIHVNDIEKAIGFTDDQPARAGYVYANASCYIEALADGTFYLLIEREAWNDADLTKLERILWDEFYLPEIAANQS